MTANYTVGSLSDALKDAPALVKAMLADDQAAMRAILASQNDSGGALMFALTYLGATAMKMIGEFIGTDPQDVVWNFQQVAGEFTSELDANAERLGDGAQMDVRDLAVRLLRERLTGNAPPAADGEDLPTSLDDWPVLDAEPERPSKPEPRFTVGEDGEVGDSRA